MSIMIIDSGISAADIAARVAAAPPPGDDGDVGGGVEHAMASFERVFAVEWEHWPAMNGVVDREAEHGVAADHDGSPADPLNSGASIWLVVAGAVPFGGRRSPSGGIETTAARVQQ